MNKVLIAFTSGLILGMLYAPRKGSDTRDKIANLGNSLKEDWNALTDRLAGRIDRVREHVDRVADKAVEKVENTQFQTKSF